MDRLLGILICLLQSGKATAPELARRFEVSRRTILRDVESLCAAGIPIVTLRGGDGGIAIMEGYRLDHSLLTPQELQSILAGLRGIDSVSENSALKLLLQKLAPQNRDAPGDTDPMRIDLASFHRGSLSEKIERLKLAIAESRLAAFRYYYAKGEADKRVEPYRIVYQWSDWYLFGYCTQRQDFRMYKLKRLWELELCEQRFHPRSIPKERENFGGYMTDSYLVSALYAPAHKYRLVEEYGPSSFQTRADGRLFARYGFAGPEEALAWFLTFGDGAEVLDPPEMLEKLRAVAEKVVKLYPRT